jgi:hypothetical protein
MAKFISIAANSKHLDKILKKAKSLGSIPKNEISWDDGFKYSDKSNRNIQIFDHSETLWNYIEELEPSVDLSRKKKALENSHLTIPTSEEVIKLGY